MKICINQPYFLPYLGLFEKIKFADLFVVNDYSPLNIENITHRRSTILKNYRNNETIVLVELVNRKYDGVPFTKIPLNKEFYERIEKIIRTIHGTYARSKNYNYLSEQLYYEMRRTDLKTLALYNTNLLTFLMRKLNIKTKVIVASECELLSEDILYKVPSDYSNRGTYSTVYICKKLSADFYISGENGHRFLDSDKFSENNIKIIQHINKLKEYPQFDIKAKRFIPMLSSIDLLFHNGQKAGDFIGKNSEFRRL